MARMTRTRWTTLEESMNEKKRYITGTFIGGFEYQIQFHDRVARTRRLVFFPISKVKRRGCSQQEAFVWLDITISS